MDATYWPLLPADESAKADRGRRKSSSYDADDVKRRVLTRVACNPCRTKKAAVCLPCPVDPFLLGRLVEHAVADFFPPQCDGQRPCTSCSKRGRPCSYLSKHEQETPLMVLKRQNDDLESKAGALAELLACFKYASEDASLDMLMRLRDGEEPRDVLAGIKDVPEDSMEMEDVETIFRARDQELELTELDEDMFPAMEIEYLDEFGDDTISPELWLDGESCSASSSQSSPQSSPAHRVFDSPNSSQNSSRSSPAE
jgi:hypothetical protein